MKIILAIDDDRTTLSLIESQLEGLRYRLFMETSAKRGIESARTLNPDLVILDINMPVINGLEALRQMKKDPITRDVPVIMLTAVTDRAVVLDAMRQGIIDYITKPWDRDKLHTKIFSALRYRELQQIEKRMDDSSFINISRDGDMVLLSFTERPGSKEFLAEAKTVFNAFFIGQIRNKTCVIDLRSVADFTESDTRALEVITRLFGENGVNVIAGRHYGAIVAASDIDEKTNLFISYGDMEVFLKSGRKA